MCKKPGECRAVHAPPRSVLAVIRVVADRLSAVERVEFGRWKVRAQRRSCRASFNPPLFWRYGGAWIWGDSMAHHRKESGLDVIASTPWPTGIVLGVVRFGRSVTVLAFTSHRMAARCRALNGSHPDL